MQNKRNNPFNGQQKLNQYHSWVFQSPLSLRRLQTESLTTAESSFSAKSRSVGIFETFLVSTGFSIRKGLRRVEEETSFILATKFQVFEALVVIVVVDVAVAVVVAVVVVVAIVVVDVAVAVVVVVVRSCR